MTVPHSHEAETQLEQLRTALAANGITLPSLALDPLAPTRTYAPPLVALGNCNLATVGALTAVLRKAAEQ